MTPEVEFDLTLNLPCSTGVLAHDIECRVTVSYEVEAGSVDWELVDVRIDGQPGVIRKDCGWEFELFKAAIKFTKGGAFHKSAEQTVISECFDHWQATRVDPDRLLEEKRDREMEEQFA